MARRETDGPSGDGQRDRRAEATPMSGGPLLEIVNAEGEVVRLRYRDGSHEDVEVRSCLLDDDHSGVDLRGVETGRRYNVLVRNADLLADRPLPLYRRESLDRPMSGTMLPEPPATEPDRWVVGIELPPSRIRNDTDSPLYEMPWDEGGRRRSR
jgi:hypothetical protein